VTYQPLPFNWKLVFEMRRRTFRRQVGHFVSAGSLMRWDCSNTPHLPHSYS